MHRAAVAEMIYTLQPDKKLEAVKLIEQSSNNMVPTKYLSSYFYFYIYLFDISMPYITIKSHWALCFII